jgi:hypothetical protein
MSRGHTLLIRPGYSVPSRKKYAMYEEGSDVGREQHLPTPEASKLQQD